MAARFLIEEDEEQMKRELKEAFRFYDREGEWEHSIEVSRLNCGQFQFTACRVGLPDDRDVEGYPARAGTEPGRGSGLCNTDLNTQAVDKVKCRHFLFIILN